MAVEIKVAALGESVVEATVLRWVKNAGDIVSAGDVVAELETDKVNVEVASDASGLLEKIVKGEGENVAIGDVLAVVNEQAAAPKSASNRRSAATAVSTQAPTPTTAVEASAPASPLPKKLAGEKATDLGPIKGTGA